ncbi:MAG TPA: EAL domain-containing protein [Gammaproteobacteria bacterium]|jgi:diguanylate cyclase (GGDEF)-like protein/PAS domain S-box-containing protein
MAGLLSAALAATFNPLAPAIVVGSLIGSGIALVTLGLWSAWQYAQASRVPLARVIDALNLTAQGDLESALALDDSPESAALGKALESVRGCLRESRVSRDYLDRLLSSMSEAILVVDSEQRIERANNAALTMLDYDIGTLVGASMSDILVDSGDRRLDENAALRPREGAFRRRDGTLTHVSYTVSSVSSDDGSKQSLLYAAQNIDDRKKVEQRIRYLARTDSLTKIANRMQFQHLMQQTIARAKRSGQYLGLLYLDADRFKDINDTFGHAAGDTSLAMFVRRIIEVVPEGSIAGRLAGDEFAVLLGPTDDIDRIIEQVTNVGAKVLRAVGKPFEVQGEEIFMTTSIGVALYPRDGDNVVDLLRRADAALYQAKKAGGNCLEFYSQHMDSSAEERLMLKNKLRRAFERNELRLHYQPKYAVRSGRIAGAEALVRWDLPNRGLVLPAHFIPLAEETNLILQIGDWVLNRVCADYRDWQRSVPSPCRVSVNLSLRQLQQQKFLEGVRNAFRTHGISPTCFELEITETTLMEDTDRTIRILDALYGMGLHLAIDDFGTGYSSLSALQQFPISTLKIDQSFVRDVSIDRDNAAIVKTIIQMAHSLGLEVVAEGVESQDQLAFLKSQRCDYAQGHLFGDPMTSDEFCALLIAEAGGSGRYQALFG